MSAVVAVVAVVPVAFLACAAPRIPASPPVTTTTIDCVGLTLTLRGDAQEVALVAMAAPPACAALEARGLALRRPVGITLHADVDGFVAATGQTVDTLRAWSTPEAVHLLTLSSWRRRDGDAVTRRLTHELCHVALFHRHGDDARRIPRALGEGFCSVVAGQEDERLPLAEVRARADDGEVVDFVDDSPFAYGVAHHVVAGIARCRGDAALLPLLDAVAAGQRLVDVLRAPPLAFLGPCPEEGAGTTDGDAVDSPR